ncbi:uncharacterized protein BDV14DRAFT_198552 [Aspergillus stella-maris]|uniref:uncharacterized protein n=1 Tax=Aspergillus stella-maris TaxID=1810926 RepID=UPI003CCE1C3F
MSPENSAGRIHKTSFIVSIYIFFFGFAVLGVLLRCFIRFRVRQSRIAADDTFLLVAFALLIASMIIMYQEVIDRMYVAYSLVIGVEGVVPPADWRDMSSKFHLWSSICLTLVWLSFSAVKLSFLFFFKTLNDRLRPWMIYWWAITIFNVAVLIYVTCSTGDRNRIIVAESVVLMVMDTVGDILILAIPFSIIWRIRVRLSQKIILTCSLCLTIVMIALSIARVCGLVDGDAIDSIWQTYRQFLSSEIGVFLASAVAFRSFFTARTQASNPIRYSIKRALKQSLSGSNSRRRDNLRNSWYLMPESKLDPLSQSNTTGPETQSGAPTAPLEGDNDPKGILHRSVLNNVIVGSFWTTLEVFKDLTLLQCIRNEFHSCLLSQPVSVAAAGELQQEEKKKKSENNPQLKINIENLLQQPFLQAVFAETLHLRVNGFFLWRVSHHDINVRGWHIAKDHYVATHQIPGHMNPGFWSSASASKGTFMPFGSGDHYCPGRRFAKVITLLCTALLVEMYDVEILSDAMNVGMSMRNFGFEMLGPDQAISVRMRRR